MMSFSVKPVSRIWRFRPRRWKQRPSRSVSVPNNFKVDLVSCGGLTLKTLARDRDRGGAASELALAFAQSIGPR